jgi:histidine kinase
MIPPSGYTLTKCLSSTQRSEVYAALREGDGLEVVLKCYRADRASVPLSRAAHELGLLQRVAGEGIVRALEMDVSGARPVLVLERCPGVPLSDADGEPLSLAELLGIGVRLGESLARIHQARVLHNDLKPGNILFQRKRGALWICDFGSACEFGASGTLGDAHAAEGTLHYISPEQTGRMDRGMDFRSDLYAFGATLYHLLTGRPPFDSQDALELMHAHIAQRPRPLRAIRPDVPRMLERIVLKLLEKDPELRYQTARALQLDLAKCLEQLESTGSVADGWDLGVADAPLRPIFKKKLYGRDAEVATLQRAFEHVAGGGMRLLLISGTPGSGKSALIEALRGRVSDSDGHLALGKFDAYRRDHPYAGFVAAFESLVHQRLAEPEARLAVWRNELLSSLGRVARALVDMVPDLGLVLGELPGVPSLGPNETQSRLVLVAQRFVRACARRAHPLALFLDDLHWADAGSRSLLEALLSEGGAEALLVIGAYRTDEVRQGDPLHSMLERIAAQGVAIDWIHLGPLSTAAATELLSDALGRPAAETRALAEQIERKTGNTPLLIHQFVEHMHELGLLRFEHPRGWTWDVEGIAAAAIPDDAVGLLTARIERIDSAVSRILQVASCVGDEFDAALLAELTGSERRAVESALYTLCDEGLIGPCRTGFRFLHDRVREAAQGLWDDDERARFHFEIAAFLLRRTPAEALDEHVIEIAEHLLRGSAWIPDDERARALEVQAKAGRRALRSGASETAHRHLTAARVLFRESDWEAAPKLAFDLHWRAAETAQRLKDYEGALETLDALERRPLAPIERARVQGLRVTILMPARGVEHALLCTLEYIRGFGIRWDRHPSSWRIHLTILVTDWLVRRRLMQPENAPARKGGSPDWIAPLVLVNSGGTAMTLSATRLLLLGCALCLRRYALRTPLPGLGFALAAYGATRIVFRRDSSRAREYADASLRWRDALRDSRLDARTDFQVYSMLRSWVEPRRSILQKLAQLSEAFLELGDREYTAHSQMLRAQFMALVGEPLGIVTREFERAVTMAINDRRHSGQLCARPYDFLGVEAPAPDVLSKELADLRALLGRSPHLAGHVSVHWLAVLSLLGRFDDAHALAEQVGPLIFEVNALGTHVADALLFQGMTAAVMVRRGIKRSRKVLRSCLRDLQRFARHGSDFAHMALLLEAEAAALRRSPDLALDLYQKSAERALRQEYRHHAALAHERHARLLIHVRRYTTAARELRHAASLYEEWGAAAKVPLLLREMESL